MPWVSVDRAVTKFSSNHAHASVETRCTRVTWLQGQAWVLLLLAATGCLNRHRALPTVPAAAEPAPPLRFTSHDLGDDSVVRVVTPHTACTGTVIEARLVLTAHHCIAARNEFGDYLEQDVAADDIEVQLGGDYLPWGEVEVEATVAPPCG